MRIWEYHFSVTGTLTQHATWREKMLSYNDYWRAVSAEQEETETSQVGSRVYFVDPSFRGVQVASRLGRASIRYDLVHRIFNINKDGMASGGRSV